MFARGSWLGLVTWAALAFGSAGQAQQDPGRGRQPGPGRKLEKQGIPEPRKISSKFESWYTVRQDERHLGSVQVLLNPYERGPDGTEEVSYIQRLTIDLPGPEGKGAGVRIHQQVVATLTRDFDLKTFELRYQFLGRHHRATYDAERNEILLEVVGEGQPRRIPLGKVENPYLHPEIALMILAQKGELLRETHTLSLLVFKEKELALEPIKLKVEGSETRRYMDRLVDVIRLSVDDPPPFYNIRHIWIDVYGRVMEYRTSTGIRVQIARDAQFTRLENQVETWYAAAVTDLKQEVHVGWAMSRLKRLPLGFEYTWESRGRVGMFDAVLSEVQEHHVRLSNNFETQQATFRRTFSHLEWSAEYRGGRTVEYTDPAGRKRTARLGPEEKFYPTLDLAVMALAQREDLLKAGIHNVVLLDPAAMGVLRVQISVLKVVRRIYLGEPFFVLHIRATAEKRPPVHVYVDKYGRPLEISVHQGLRYIAVRGEEQAKGRLKEPLPPAEARDPTEPQLTEEGPPREKYEDIRREVEAVYLEIRETFETMNENRQDERLLERLLPKFTRSVESFNRLLQKLVDKFPDDVERDPQIKVWGDLVSGWEELVKGVIVPKENVVVKRLQELSRGFVRAVANRDLEAARKIMGEVQAVESDLQELGDEERKQWEARIARMKAQFRRLEIQVKMDAMVFDIPAIAWERRTHIHPVPFRIDLFGIGISQRESARLIVTRAYALIDGRIYREGDSLVKDGVKLTVFRIEKDTVTFAFQDLRKTVLMKK